MKKVMLCCLFLILTVILIAEYNDTLPEELDSAEGQNRIHVLKETLSALDFSDHELYYRVATELLELSDRYDDIAGLAYANYHLFKYEIEQSNYNAALEYQEKAIAFFNRLSGFEWEFAELYTSRGVVLKNLGRYQSSLESYYKAMEYMSDVDDLELEANFHQGMGVTYWTLRHYDKALEHFQNSTELAEKIDDKKIIAGNYTNIGNIHSVLGNHDIAIEHYKLAIEILEEMPVSVFLANTYHNLGLVSRKTDEKHLSVSYCQKALELFIETGYKRGEAFAYNSLARLYIDAGEYENALEQIHASINLRESLGDIATLSVSYRFASEIYMELEDYENTKHYMILALDTAKKTETYKLTANALMTHANYYEKHNDYNRAFDYLKQYVEYQGKIFSDETAEIKAQLASQYEVSQLQYEMENLRYEKQINQLELSKNRRIRNLYFGLFAICAVLALSLIRQNRSKVKANKQITQSYDELDKHKNELEELYEKQSQLLKEVENLNNTKDKLFSIVSHDLKSSLNSIKTGTRMLSDEFDSLSQEDIRMIAGELKKNSDSLAILLHNLLTWARAHLGSIEYDPCFIKIADAIDYSISTFGETAKQKKLTIEKNISPEVYAYADKVMLNSIFQNLISNAIKFSNPGGIVEITANMDAKNSYIKFKDNGIGMSKDQVAKLYDLQNKKSQRGTAGEKGTGLGLNLCKEFIEYNNGDIDITSTPGEGTEIIVTLPKGELE